MRHTLEAPPTCWVMDACSAASCVLVICHLAGLKQDPSNEQLKTALSEAKEAKAAPPRGRTMFDSPEFLVRAEACCSDACHAIVTCMHMGCALLLVLDSHSDIADALPPLPQAKLAMDPRTRPMMANPAFQAILADLQVSVMGSRDSRQCDAGSGSGMPSVS